MQMEYPLPESMLKPKSMPEYYERLMRSIDRASRGKGWRWGGGRGEAVLRTRVGAGLFCNHSVFMSLLRLPCLLM